MTTLAQLICRLTSHRTDPLVAMAAQTLTSGDTLEVHCTRCGTATGNIKLTPQGFTFSNTIRPVQ